MKSKDEIVANWLPRYTGVPLEDFARYVLLVNFQNYLDMFAAWHNVPVQSNSGLTVKHLRF
jgi:AMP nucleosidase